MRLVQIAIIVALAVIGPANAEPRLSVKPDDVVEGEPVQIVITGLSPGETVKLRASRLWSAYPKGEEHYHSAASFVADARGEVDLRTAIPLAGSSYQNADPAGLFWSMTAEKRKSAPVSAAATKPQASTAVPGMVSIKAESGGTVLLAHMLMRPAAKDVAVREVRENGVTGVFAKKGSRERLPAVIVLGGSEGGLFTARWAAPIIASHGYAVLGVGYFQGDEPDLASLPSNLENIPLETIARARDWLSRQPGVDASRIALVGVSKGAEMALVSATAYPWVRAVAAFAPSHVVWEGIPPADRADSAAGSSWTVGGKPLPFVRWSKAAETRANAARKATGSSRMTETHLESLAEFAKDVEAAIIPIENSSAVVFIAAGIDDGMWPSAYSAGKIRQRLLFGNKRTATFEIHPTGHQIMGSGWGPTTQFQRPSGHLQGGNAQLDAEAQKMVWPSFLKFLEDALRREVPAGAVMK